MSEEGPGEAEVVAHMAVVAHRVASAIAREFPEPTRSAAIAAAERVLLDDEGARELLAAAFDEGRADAVASGIRSAVGVSPDWSDVESRGERLAIAREESACSSCSAAEVCAVSQAVRSVGALVVLARCDKHR